jgi:hypothetical protein
VIVDKGERREEEEKREERKRGRKKKRKRGGKGKEKTGNLPKNNQEPKTCLGITGAFQLNFG